MSVELASRSQEAINGRRCFCLQFCCEKLVKENFYCHLCGGWVYFLELNLKYQGENGRIIEKLAIGCLKQDEKGEYLECPGCKARFYLTD